MQRIFLSISVALFFLGVIHQADAHVLQVSGDIGAVMHIDPDDDPIAGQQSNFFFEFKDQKGKFRIDSCTCTVEIKEGNTILSTIPLSAVDSPTTGTISFTFPKTAAYSVILSGKPQGESSFAPFSLTYPLRVERQTQETDSGDKKGNLPIFQIIALLAVIGGISIYIVKGRK